MFSFFQEAAVRASEVSAAVRALDVTVGQTQHHPCDLSSAQAEAVLPICEDVSEVKTSDMNVAPSSFCGKSTFQEVKPLILPSSLALLQMDILRRTLQQVVEPPG